MFLFFFFAFSITHHLHEFFLLSIRELGLDCRSFLIPFCGTFLVKDFADLSIKAIPETLFFDKMKKRISRTLYKEKNQKKLKTKN